MSRARSAITVLSEATRSGSACAKVVHAKKTVAISSLFIMDETDPPLSCKSIAKKPRIGFATTEESHQDTGLNFKNYG